MKHELCSLPCWLNDVEPSCGRSLDKMSFSLIVVFCADIKRPTNYKLIFIICSSLQGLLSQWARTGTEQVAPNEDQAEGDKSLCSQTHPHLLRWRWWQDLVASVHTSVTTARYLPSYLSCHFPAMYKTDRTFVPSGSSLLCRSKGLSMLSSF